jgi:hypothetical protein
MHYENVVCDFHHLDMVAVQVKRDIGLLTKVLDGHANCAVSGCNRFFGTEGYCDLTERGEFVNVRKEPVCSTGHESIPMYLQRTPERLRWVCPVCNAEGPHKSSD